MRRDAEREAPSDVGEEEGARDRGDPGGERLIVLPIDVEAVFDHREADQAHDRIGEGEAALGEQLQHLAVVAVQVHLDVGRGVRHEEGGDDPHEHGDGEADGGDDGRDARFCVVLRAGDRLGADLDGRAVEEGRDDVDARVAEQGDAALLFAHRIAALFGGGAHDCLVAVQAGRKHGEDARDEEQRDAAARLGIGGEIEALGEDLADGEVRKHGAEMVEHLEYRYSPQIPRHLIAEPLQRLQPQKSHFRY